MKRLSDCLLITTLSVLFVSANHNSLFGQMQTETLAMFEEDSLSHAESWDEETYYQIGILRLQRWAKNNAEKLNDQTLSAEIARLIKEADTFAKSADFDLANTWLETVWELIESAENLSEFSPEGDFDFGNSDLDQHSKSNWTREILTGVDLWRQEFSFTFLQQDSTFLEGNGNPYSGARLGFSSKKSQSFFEGSVFFKYSRDYLSGDAFLKYENAFAGRSSIKLENRFEGTSFFRDFDLKYWQNKSTLAFIPRLGAFSFEVRDDFTLRRYANADSTYPNYYSNDLDLSLKCNVGLVSFLDLGYRNLARNHSDFSTNDYGEHKFYLAWTQSIGTVLDFSLDNEFRFRDYKNAPADHYLQDFNEYYGWTKIDMKLTKNFGIEIDGALTKRAYDFKNANSLPDYLYWEAKPQIYARWSSSWRISVGLYYDEQKYQNLVNRVPATDALNSSISAIQFENYYSVGPTITLDFFKINSLLFSLQESYLFRRYPNSPTNSAAFDNVSFNLNADRNINNILLFMTWDVTKSWQLNALVNMDDDRSRKDDTGDSQNTLLGLEVNYRF